jgi:uncharacterized delta-60 repeat protein
MKINLFKTKKIIVFLFMCALSFGLSVNTTFAAPGDLDTTFNPGTGANSGTRKAVIQSDGKIIIVGYFTTYNGVSRNRIVRINTDGSLDTTFNPGTGFDSVAFNIHLQADGKVIVTGYFTTYNGVSRNRIARINTDGSLDTTFNPGTGLSSGSFDYLKILNNGKILAGSSGLYAYNGTPIGRMIRINSNGSLDTTFTPGVTTDNTVFAVSEQTDGKLMVVGNFTTYNGVSILRAARINPDGSLDTTFNPGTSATGGFNAIFGLTIQVNGKIILYGAFAVYNGASRSGIVRVNTDGSIDTTFNPGGGTGAAGNYPEGVIIQPDNKLILTGNFTTYNGTARGNIARVDNTPPQLVEFSAATASSTNETTANNFPSLKVTGTFLGTETVQVAITGGTATAGTDYTYTTPTTVTIPAGVYTNSSIALTAPALVQDTVVEGGETITFTLQSPTGGLLIGDADANATTQTTHTYTITDDEIASFTRTPGTRTVLENGGTNTFTVVLGAQPVSDVVFDITSGSVANVTVSPSTLTFTNANWNTAQTVTVTGVNDNIDTATDDTATVTISVNDASSDNAFDPLADQTVVVTATDDDVAAFTFSPSIILTENTNGTASVVLATQPLSNVVINVSSGDTTAVTVSPSTLTFTPLNWNTAQTVTLTAVNDPDALNESTTITATVNDALSSNEYDPIADKTITVTVNDDDTPNFTLSANTFTGVLDTSTVTTNVVLTALPASNVVIKLTSANPLKLTSNVSTLTFTQANWNTPQTVTLSPVLDTDIVKETTLMTFSIDALLSSDEYDLVSNKTASVSVVDSDDIDQDGTSNTYEDAGSNSGDGNGDGTPDKNQSNVSGAFNPVTNSYTTLQATGVCTFIEENAYVAEGTLSNQDPTYDYPVGLAKFKLRCPTPGASASVKLYYTQAYTTTPWSYKKFDSLGNIYSDITPLVTFGTATVGGNLVTTATFTLTDGDPATDEDKTADGYINDPSGPAILAPVITASSGGGAVILLTQNTNNQTLNTLNTSQNLIGGGEPNVPVEFSNYVCKRYLREYIYTGKTNNPEEVKKLQSFLNDKEGEKLALDGTYDAEDILAVKRFQSKYTSQILSLWGSDTATGRVFKTTAAKINLMSCQNQLGNKYFTEYLKEGDSSLETVKLQDFLNIIFAPTSGYPTSGLPLSKTFDAKTKAKLKEFQSVYKETVLKPWNLTSPTGRFYQTTRKASNLLMGYDEGAINLKK